MKGSLVWRVFWCVLFCLKLQTEELMFMLAVQSLSRALLLESCECYMLTLCCGFGAVWVGRRYRTRPQLHCQQLVLAVENQCIAKQMILGGYWTLFWNHIRFNLACCADPTTMISLKWVSFSVFPVSTKISGYLKLLSQFPLQTKA